jgi:DNA-binding LacI/PurR family transcriptional regulator
MYLLKRTNKNSEFQIINQTAREHNYHPNNTAFRMNTNTKPINTLHITQNIPSHSVENNKKWAILTYVGKETRHITKLFKIHKYKTSF